MELSTYDLNISILRSTHITSEPSSDDIRATYDRAYHRHMSNLDVGINAVHDPMCTAADLRRYADACDESRAELQRASRALNQSSGQVTE